MPTLDEGLEVAHALTIEGGRVERRVREFWIQIVERLGEPLADSLLMSPLLQQSLNLVGLVRGEGVVLLLAQAVQPLLALEGEVKSSLNRRVGFFLE